MSSGSRAGAGRLTALPAKPSTPCRPLDRIRACAFTEDGGVDGQTLGLAGLGWDDLPRGAVPPRICRHAGKAARASS